MLMFDLGIFKGCKLRTEESHHWPFPKSLVDYNKN